MKSTINAYSTQSSLMGRVPCQTKQKKELLQSMPSTVETTMYQMVPPLLLTSGADKRSRQARWRAMTQSLKIAFCLFKVLEHLNVSVKTVGMETAYDTCRPPVKLHWVIQVTLSSDTALFSTTSFYICVNRISDTPKTFVAFYLDRGTNSTI